MKFSSSAQEGYQTMRWYATSRTNFSWVCKHIRDAIRYLHSNPETTYSPLMVAARKAESEMEDAKEKVRARSSTATEMTDSSKELGDQITRLMAWPL